MAATPKHLVRADDRDARDSVCIRHPFNPSSEVHLQRLAERTGMERVAVTLVRVPPGWERFILHAHLLLEEFLYILEGSGTAVIGGAQVTGGPGDFMGFPIDGTPHTLRNCGSTDLVYLMGGERGPVDVAHFPSVGKTLVFSQREGIRASDDANARQLSLDDFQAKG